MGIVPDVPDCWSVLKLLDTHGSRWDLDDPWCCNEAHHWLKFAPSPLVMGKSRISAVTPSSPVTQVIWRPVNMTRGTRDRLQKVTPKKKGQQAAKTNQTPTTHASWTMQEDHQFPDDQEDSYSAMNDPPPLDRCKTSKNQVHHVMMICFFLYLKEKTY